MLALLKNQVWLRIVTVFTIATFLPSAAGAWNFFPREPEAEETSAPENPWTVLPWVTADTAESGDYAQLPWQSADGDRKEGAVRPPLRMANLDTPIEGADDNVDLENSEEPRPGGTLTEHGYEPIQLAKVAPRLPDARELINRIMAEGTEPVEEQSEERVKVAQLIPLSPWDLGATTAGDEAGSVVTEANNKFLAGQFAAAALDYVDIMALYPSSMEALAADRGLVSFMEGTLDGVIPYSEMNAFKAQLPPWDSLGVEAQYGLVSMYNQGVEVASERGDVTGINFYMADAMATVQAFCREHPNHPLIQSSIDYWHDTAKVAGPEHVDALISELLQIADLTAPNGGNFAGVFHKVSVLDILSQHFGGAERNYAPSDHYSGMLAGAANGPVFRKLFDDPKIYAWVKGWYALIAGSACWRLEKYDDALNWYNLGIATAPGDGHTRHQLEFYAARTYSVLAGEDYHAGILAFDGFLKSFPDTSLKDRTLLEMGALYLRAGDWSSALDFFTRVVEGYPGSDAAKACQGEIDFINSHLRGAVWVARASHGSGQTLEPAQLAQMCGPYALKAWLKTKGQDVDLEELANLAGTGPDGTSMHGLVKAAHAYQLELSGEAVIRLDDIKPPFIAFVDNDHYVYVESIHDGQVIYEDISRGRTEEDLAEFTSSWTGLALVERNAERLAFYLPEDYLDLITGGTDHDSGSSVNDDPFECDGGGYPPGQSVGLSGGGPPSCSIKSDDDPGSPTTGTGSNSPGVNVTIDMFQSRMRVHETDLFIAGLGSTAALFTRTYVNNYGFEKSYFTAMGNGWTNNVNTENGFPGTSYPGQVMISSSLTYEPGNDWIYWDEVKTIRRSGGGKRVITSWDNQYGELCNPGAVSVSHPSTYIYTENGVTFEYEATSPIGSASITCGYYVDPFTVSATTVYRLKKVSDTGQNDIEFGYDPYGKLTQLTVPGSVSRRIDLSYDGNARVTKASLKYDGSEIAKADYLYNGNGDLTKVTDTNGNDIVYEYGTNGSVTGSRYITKITDRMSNDTTFAYAFGQDAMSNWEATKITVTNAVGKITEYDRSITTDIGTLTVKDGSTVLRKMVNTPVNGNLNLSAYKDYYLDTTNYERWTYQYNTKGKLTKVLTPATDVWQEYGYDSYDRLTKARRGTGPWTYFYYPNPTAEYANSIVGPDGTNTVIYYDTSNRITKVAHPSVGTNGTVYSYDGYGQVTRVTDPSGEFTDYAYDGLGNLTAVSDPNSNVTTFAYDDYGNVTSVTDPRSKTTTYEYATGACGGCGGSFGLLTKVTDPLSEYTTMAYDTNGNLTKVTDALGVVTDYFYDAMNRLTKVQTPAPSGPYMTLAYDKQGQVVSRTDFEGGTTAYEYDHRQRLTKSTDPIDDVTVAYASDGLLDSVTDGLGHSTVYDYDGAFRLTSITDAESKVVKYFYDTAGRMIKVGAGASGTFDPTEYFFDATTGLMTKVRYTSGANTFDANYFYDSLARVVKITDWIDGTNGLRYGYDDGGRLTSITDYDNSTLTYAYDAAGNVTSMTDYHGNTTAYTYTDRNELSTLTAPGSKTWTFHYNDIGQPTYYNIPNGMTTNYGYDSRNRLTTIEHKDGANVLDGFAYTLDDVGNITSTTHEDGSFWEYLYDGRYRLTTAVRSNANETIEANYAYTYDAGDNLLTKVEPFEDDFNDSNYTGWTVTSGTWTASNNYLEPTHATSTNVIRKGHTDADNEIVLRYRINDTSSNSAKASIHCRHVDGSNLIAVEIYPDKMRLVENVSGTGTVQDSNTSATSSEDVWYNLRIEADGGDVIVWRWADGELAEEVLGMTGATVSTTTTCLISVLPSYDFDFDDIRILSDDLSNTTTFAVNNANELTSMTDYNGSTSFGFDDWGRMTSKARGSYEAAYGYRYGQMLRSVTSDFPGEGNVTYDYGGDGKRRYYTVNGITTGLRWSLNEHVNDESTSGTLLRTVLANLADAFGSNPAQGTYHFLALDNLGSVCSTYDSSRTRVDSTEYAPYGSHYSQAGAVSSRGYAGLERDAQGLLELATYRAFSSKYGRWLQADPMGATDSTNLYAYVSNDPINYFDPEGLKKVCVKKTMHVTAFGPPGFPKGKETASKKKVGPGSVAVGRKPKLREDGTQMERPANGKWYPAYDPVYPYDSDVTVCGENPGDKPSFTGKVDDTGRGNEVNDRNWPADEWIDIWLPTKDDQKKWGEQVRTVIICWDDGLPEDPDNPLPQVNCD